MAKSSTTDYDDIEDVDSIPTSRRRGRAGKQPTINAAKLNTQPPSPRGKSSVNESTGIATASVKKENRTSLFSSENSNMDDCDAFDNIPTRKSRRGGKSDIRTNCSEAIGQSIQEVGSKNEQTDFDSIQAMSNLDQNTPTEQQNRYLCMFNKDIFLISKYSNIKAINSYPVYVRLCLKLQMYVLGTGNLLVIFYLFCMTLNGNHSCL